MQGTHSAASAEPGEPGWNQELCHNHFHTAGCRESVGASVLSQISPPSCTPTPPPAPVCPLGVYQWFKKVIYTSKVNNLSESTGSEISVLKCRFSWVFEPLPGALVQVTAQPTSPRWCVAQTPSPGGGQDKSPAPGLGTGISASLLLLWAFPGTAFHSWSSINWNDQ